MSVSRLQGFDAENHDEVSVPYKIPVAYTDGVPSVVDVTAERA